MWSNYCWKLGCNSFPRSISCVPANLFQKAVARSCCQGTELDRAPVQLLTMSLQSWQWHWCFLPMGGTSHLSLLSVTQLPLASSFCISRLPWYEQQPDPPKYPFVPFIWCHLQIQWRWIPSIPPATDTDMKQDGPRRHSRDAHSREGVTP